MEALSAIGSSYETAQIYLVNYACTKSTGILNLGGAPRRGRNKEVRIWTQDY